MSAASGSPGGGFMQNLRQLFAECDLDGSGHLVLAEFKELCSRIGLSSEVADETFNRLDSDKNGQITFDEFAAGFQQYKQTSSSCKAQPAPSNNNEPAQQTRPLPKSPSESASSSYRSASGSFTKLSPSPVSVRARSRASPSGPAGSLGSSGAGGSSSGRSTSSGTQFDMSSSSSYELNCSSSDMPLQQSASANDLLGSPALAPAYASEGAPAGQTAQDDVVVYSSEAIGAGASGSANYGSGQFGSMLSSSSSGYSQVKTMQDLLDCVQKLQNENQILTQIFFKDKREREEYISQLGEEFDHQLREVEERANKRAREELENEKKRLREMMQTERETLEHHYKTLEKVSKMAKSSQAHGGRLEIDEGLFKVKSQLEDTFNENRQLKKSLLDTKTDVALIWKEMEKLKKQYEDKLSSAYEKQRETQYECDHIKKQLNLMQDSNRKLQDASDVITNYITDKVEPVIKVALDGTDEHGSSSLNGPNSLKTLGAASSASNSRRGSILSEYLNTNTSTSTTTTTTTTNNNNNNNSSSSESNRTNGNAPEADSISDRVSCLEIDSSQERHSAAGRVNGSASATSLNRGSSGVSLESELSELNELDERARASENHLSVPNANYRKQFDANPKSSESTTESTHTPQRRQRAKQELEQDNLSKEACKSAGEKQPASVSLRPHSQHHQVNNPKPSALKSLGRHFMLGSRALSETKTAGSQEGDCSKVSELAEAKSASADRVQESPSVEPADGPSVATFNIILVGDSFVGKSSFAARFIEGSFVQGLISNCSIDFKTKSYKVDGVNYTVNLWDTAGQERFRSITASYFRKADGIILMYDVTDKRSYLNVRNWMSTISDTAAENVAVLLVGNKIDLRLTENKAKCVPTEEGFRLAKEYDIVFLETSVKTGTNLLPSMGKLIRLIAKNNTAEEEDTDRIRLSDKNRTFNCMPKNC